MSSESTMDRFETLIQSQLDGVISDSEAAELEVLVSSDPALAEHADAYRHMVGLVKGMPMEEPSDGFTNRVMAAIPQPAFAAAPLAGRAVDRAAARGRSWFGSRFRLAYAFSALAMVAVAAVFVFQIADFDPQAATGTIVSSDDQRVVVGDAQLEFQATAGGHRVEATVPLGLTLTLEVSGDLDSDDFALNPTRPLDLPGADEAYVFVLDGSGQIIATLRSSTGEIARESITIE